MRKESFAILFHLIPERPVFFSIKTPYDDAIGSIASSLDDILNYIPYLLFNATQEGAAIMWRATKRFMSCSGIRFISMRFQ